MNTGTSFDDRCRIAFFMNDLYVIFLFLLVFFCLGFFLISADAVSSTPTTIGLSFVHKLSTLAKQTDTPPSALFYTTTPKSCSGRIGDSAVEYISGNISCGEFHDGIMEIVHTYLKYVFIHNHPHLSAYLHLVLLHTTTTTTAMGNLLSRCCCVCRKKPKVGSSSNTDHYDTENPECMDEYSPHIPTLHRISTHPQFPQQSFCHDSASNTPSHTTPHVRRSERLAEKRKQKHGCTDATCGSISCISCVACDNDWKY